MGQAETSIEGAIGGLVADRPSIPQTARHAAARQVLDCAGVAVAASAHPAGAALREHLSLTSGSAQARLLGSGVATSAHDCAFGNGTLAHLLDFDDTGFSHPTACLLPATLAVGEWMGVTGRSLLDAMVIGYEVFERLAVAARRDEPVLRQRGVHPTSVWGAPAAAAAVSRLLDLSASQVAVAVGIAATSAWGLTQQFGSWSKGVNAGNAARAGVQAALLASVGYQGDPNGLSGPYGLFSAAIGEGHFDLASFEVELGESWAIVEPGISIKPYPACTSTLRAVDAILQICNRDSYDPSEVDRIVIGVHPDLLNTLRFRSPVDGFQGKFSLDYTVACAALDGELVISSFDEQSAARPELRAMLERVELELHPEWDIKRRHENPVTVHMRSGEVFRESVAAHKGSRSWPLSDQEIQAKYLGCTTPVLGKEKGLESLAALLTLDEIDNVRSVVDVLVS